MGEVCAPSQYGYTAKAGTSGNAHFLRTTDIRSGAVNWNTVPWCTVSDEELKKYLLRDGDVVISRAGSIGFSHLVREPRNSVFASYLIRFRPLINARYFNYFLQTPNYWASIGEQSLGIAVQNVNASRLSEIELPVAPLPEQERIVEKLDELLSDLDAGVAELKAAQRKLARYRQSLLKAAVEGALTADWRTARRQSQGSGAELLRRILIERRARWEEVQLSRFAERGRIPPKNWKEKYVEPSPPNLESLPDLPTGWTWATIEQLSVVVADGVHKKPNYVDAGIPFVTVRNLTAGPGISFSNLRYISHEDHAEFIKRTHPERGDILVSKDGTLGVTRLVETDAVFSIFVSVALIKPVIREMGRFLAIAISSPVVQRQMTPKGSGLAHIHLEDLRQDCVPIPPLDEQGAIRDTLERSLDFIEKQEAQLKYSLLQSAAQRKNILKSAFAGLLIPQDPNDEAASALLARIRVERAAASSGNNKHGRIRKTA